MSTVTILALISIPLFILFYLIGSKRDKPGWIILAFLLFCFSISWGITSLICDRTVETEQIYPEEVQINHKTNIAKVVYMEGDLEQIIEYRGDLTNITSETEWFLNKRENYYGMDRGYIIRKSNPVDSTYIEVIKMKVETTPIIEQSQENIAPLKK